MQASASQVAGPTSSSVPQLWPRSPSRSPLANQVVIINQHHDHRLAHHPVLFPLPMTTKNEIDRCGLLLRRENSLSDAIGGYLRRLTRTEMR